MELNFTSKVLYQVAEPIPQNEDITELYRAMFDLMLANNGIGLAAPQAGISKRLIVFRLGNIPYTIINPIITKRKLGTMKSIEGCLSFPETLGKRGKLVEVLRDKLIVVEGFNQYWKPTRLKLRGLDSCVIQHEIDHLNGITIIKPRQKNETLGNQ
jgi:peptide deformylase